MRIHSLILFTVILFVTACGNNETRPATEKQITSIRFIDSIKDYGTIIEDQKIVLSFRFRNSGDKPLIIESVKPSCGCTVADYPKEPIAPGAEGEITGEFNSHDKVGFQQKEITVTANTSPAQSYLQFQVNVNRDPKAETN
jgi:hypothetical protein